MRRTFSGTALLQVSEFDAFIAVDGGYDYNLGLQPIVTYASLSIHRRNMSVAFFRHSVLPLPQAIAIMTSRNILHNTHSHSHNLQVSN
jgi:hypothetical protein